MENLIIHLPTNNGIGAFEEIVKNVGGSLEERNNGAAKKDKPYNPEFVAKILKSQQQVREGKVTRIKTEDLWK